MDTRTPPPRNTDLIHALHEGRSCDYCPPDAQRRANRAIFAVDVISPGRELREVRFICTRCEIAALDRIFGREVLTLNTPDGDFSTVVGDLRSRLEQLEGEVDKRRTKKPKGGAA